MKKLAAWKVEYLNEVKCMTNEELLGEYTYYSSGDLEDGGYSLNAIWMYTQLDKELYLRLKT